MTEHTDPVDINYLGSPSPTSDGRDILAYHLERYVSEWFNDKTVSHFYITIGFERSAFASVSFQLSHKGATTEDVNWTFEDLRLATYSSDNHINFKACTGSDKSDAFELIPLAPNTLDGEQSALIGFILLPQPVVLSDESKHRLERLCSEAIDAYRRNAVRLFFDEHKTETTKNLLYSIMEHLPEWFGCDHSSAFFMTSNLETMTLEAWEKSQFDVLAERLYMPDTLDLPPITQQSRPERLVGMSIELDDEEGQNLFGAAVEYQRQNPSCPYQIFTRQDGRAWRRADNTDAKELKPTHHLRDRDRENQVILIPLVSEEAGGIVLLGFLSLGYCQKMPLPSSFDELLPALGDQLTSLLHHSSLYSLSSRKLRLIQKTRESFESILHEQGDTKSRLETVIGDVTSLIAEDTDVPSFAIGYIQSNNGQRILRYVHPYGWTRFNQLNLPVDIDPQDRVDSGVSSLAIRLNQSLVLAGGYGEGESLTFKNYLWVNESTSDIIDARRHTDIGLKHDNDWVPLKEYYKPARESAYATVAYPIALAGEPLGVITVEVEKPTDWTWWTGFGGQLFWSMMADTLADAFYVLLRCHGEENGD
jgi:hypothetical protein